MQGVQYWLLKSEPDVFGYPDLERARVEPWNGVRNYQARNFLRAMQTGDLALFYHSNATPSGVAGVARIARAAYPDDLQFNPDSAYFDAKSRVDDPRWSMVDVTPVRAFPRVLTLAELRALPEWADSPLVQRGTRLSVLPVTDAQFRVAVQSAALNVEEL